MKLNTKISAKVIYSVFPLDNWYFISITLVDVYYETEPHKKVGTNSYEEPGI
jgi:hypothetical protein